MWKAFLDRVISMEPEARYLDRFLKLDSWDEAKEAWANYRVKGTDLSKYVTKENYGKVVD